MLYKKVENKFISPISQIPYIYVSVYDISEKAMAPYSSTLAWRIPWAEESDRLQSMELRRVGHH